MTDDFRVIPQSNGIDELVRVVNCIHDRIDSVGLPQNGGSTSSPSFSNAFGSTGIVLSEPGASYALPVASTFVLGGVKIGDGVDVGSDGTISVLHNGLSDLQDANGEVTGEHYHLNAAQAETVYQLNTAAPSSDGLGLYGNTDGTFYFSAPIIYAGVVTQPSYTDNGDGSVTIGSGVYNLYPDPTGAGLVKQYALLGGTFTLTDGITNYIYAAYNSGSPVVLSTTNRADFAGQYFTTDTPIYTLYRSGTNIYELNFDTTAHASPEKTLYRLLDTRRFERVSGMSLADAGNGTFTVTQGVVWYAITRTPLDSFNSSTDSTHLYYYNGSSWAYNAITGYNNTNYQGPSGLSTLPGGKYNVNWVYRSISSSKTCFIILGSAAYTLNDAIAAQPPGNVPDVVSTTAMLVGKIIVSQGAASSSAVYSAFDVQYSGGVSSGTVTSVGLSLPAIFTVTNSPVTTSGTLTATFASQTGNTFLAAPNAADGVPTFRAPLAVDISNSTTAGRALLTAADVPAQRTALGVVADTLVVHKAGVETMTALKKISLNAADIAAMSSEVLLQLIGQDSANTRLEIDAIGGIPMVAFYQMRGTAASPTPTQSGDQLGLLTFKGRGTAGLITGAAIDVRATENYTASACGSALRFTTTPNGSATNRTVGEFGQDGILYANYGINLGGTANLSAYDEGTWTPTPTNLGGTGITYSAKWVRVGNTTHLSLVITGTGITSTAGSTTVTIPFTPRRASAGGVVTAGLSQTGICLANEAGLLYLPTIASTTAVRITVTLFNN